eukprot:CAMPEP_0185532554 /NCGR_PEP_ID=MMETSP1366-20130426/108005_1 /TAXON_ID=38817 /ORGANISM="Gephyrocapsa oceanica, Strain RCC1303" /LENGTH=243 /DNA_ID=CAMNT_0028144277 /DNA_START=288 /DNA_END=1015 /DNA_ORIENTATION=+
MRVAASRLRVLASAAASLSTGAPSDAAHFCVGSFRDRDKLRRFAMRVAASRLRVLAPPSAERVAAHASGQVWLDEDQVVVPCAKSSHRLLRLTDVLRPQQEDLAVVDERGCGLTLRHHQHPERARQRGACARLRRRRRCGQRGRPGSDGQEGAVEWSLRSGGAEKDPAREVLVQQSADLHKGGRTQELVLHAQLAVQRGWVLPVAHESDEYRRIGAALEACSSEQVQRHEGDVRTLPGRLRGG